MLILHSILLLAPIGLFFALSCSGEREDGVAEKIIAIERAALDRWGKGDPWGFTEISADEVTYYDPDTERRLDGLEALRKFYAAIEGKIRIERYEIMK